VQVHQYLDRFYLPSSARTLLSGGTKPSVRSQPPQIMLGKAVTDGPEPENAADGSATKKRRRSSSADDKEGWYRMLRR
ncbi:MAG: hypothetical protein Q9212_004102, partial [Teloschistes hypoglaucus]